MRERITLTHPWQATITDADRATLFVPGSWTGKRILLVPALGVSFSSVRTSLGEAVRSGDHWDLTDLVTLGTEQEVTVTGGPIAGTVLTATDPLHIARLAAWFDPPDALSIRLCLSASPAATGRSGLITLYFTLTNEQGDQVGQQEVTVGPKTNELVVAMNLRRVPAGRTFLKAALCQGQAVIDDGRIDLESLR